MITFHVNDMTCGHCASAIARAISEVDPAARMDIRIHQKLVRVTSTAAVDELAAAIRDAGYTPLHADAQPVPAGPAAGCGCGCSGRAAALDRDQAAPVRAASCCA
jgi:copper chaperone